MAKIKKRKLQWKASESPQVVGYKLYWSEGDTVNYESPSSILGNVTQVLLPDDITEFSPGNGPIEFGITAVDELGNESDMVTFAAAYQFNVPQAPQEVSLEALDEYHATAAPPAQEESKPPVKPIQLYEKGVYCLKDQKAETEAAAEESVEEEAEEDPSATAIIEEEARALKYYGQSDQE